MVCIDFVLKKQEIQKNNRAGLHARFSGKIPRFNFCHFECYL